MHTVPCAIHPGMEIDNLTASQSSTHQMCCAVAHETSVASQGSMIERGTAKGPSSQTFGSWATVPSTRHCVKIV